MKLTDDQHGELSILAERIAEARAVARELTAEREGLVRALAAEGHSYRELSQASGLSFQRVGQIVDEDRRLDFRLAIEAWCPKCEAEPGASCTNTRRGAMFHLERHERRLLIHEGNLDDVREGEPSYMPTYEGKQR